MRLLTLADTKAPKFGCFVPRPLGCCYSTPPTPSRTVKISGAVMGMKQTEFATIRTLWGSKLYVDDHGRFNTKAIPNEPYNLLAYSSEHDIPDDPTSPVSVKKIVLERSLKSNQDAYLDIDFATQGFSPVKKTISVIGKRPDETRGGMASGMFFDISGTDPDIYSLNLGILDLNPGVANFSLLLPSDNASVQSTVLPEAQMRPGDGYEVSISANGQLGQDETHRYIRQRSKDWIAKVTLPTAPVQSVTAETGTAKIYPKIAFDKPFSSNDWVEMDLYESFYNPQGGPDGGLYLHILASGSWFGTNQSFTAPDFGAAAENPDLGFKKLTNIGWGVNRISSSPPRVLPSILSSHYGASPLNRFIFLYPWVTRFVFGSSNEEYQQSSINHSPMDRNLLQIQYTNPKMSDSNLIVDVPINELKKMDIFFAKNGAGVVMDQASVIAAYQSDTLPVSAVKLSWQPATLGQTPQFVITPKTPLTVGKTYSFTIGTGAKDVNGNAFPQAKTFTFRVVP
jgi:Bacterial Ig-like domain